MSTPSPLTGHSPSSTSTSQSQLQLQPQSQPQPHTPSSHPPRRNRAVLSCLSCRASKLKCDREQPCGQCSKRPRPDACSYAPKPDRARPPTKGMASRLRRLEGLVRTMMEHKEDGSTDGNAAATAAAAAAAAAAVGIRVPAKNTAQPRPAHPAPQEPTQEPPKETTAAPTRVGKLVMGQDGSGSYVGATHFMAMLEDIQDMKSYFEDPECEDDSPEPGDQFDAPDLVFGVPSNPRSKADFLKLLPEKQTLHRLVARYFTAAPASCYMLHRPAFQREFARFIQNPEDLSLQWLSQLFMMIALGIYYSSFTCSHELSSESPIPPLERFRHYRTIASWALVASKYINPTRTTIITLLLYLESEFIVLRATQTFGYLLLGVCIRLMLKMGMHRDPDRLGNMTPFEGEIRRRMWHLASHIDLLVGFHLGLPGFSFCIEADVKPPSNILDEDFDENSEKLPPPRPLHDHTAMAYPICKGMVMRVFAEAARLAHKLTPPTHDETMAVDLRLEEVWNSLPKFIKPRPLVECVTDTSSVIIQRFSVASLHEKCKCVLHRAYLAEKNTKQEHDYSRRRCLDGALNLLSFQIQIYDASQPGGVLHPSGWFFKSATVHDFLLGAMVIFLVLENEKADTVDAWRCKPTPTPSRTELIDLLKRSREIWWDTASLIPDVTKPAEFLDTILGRLGVPPHKSGIVATPGTTSLGHSTPADHALMGSLSLQEHQPLQPAFIPPASSVPYTEAGLQNNFPNDGQATSAMVDSWVTLAGELDWKYVDIMLSQSAPDPGVPMETDWFISGPSIMDFGGMTPVVTQSR